jgi:hypothetical protein
MAWWVTRSVRQQVHDGDTLNVRAIGNCDVVIKITYQLHQLGPVFSGMASFHSISANVCIFEKAML